MRLLTDIKQEALQQLLEFLLQIMSFDNDLLRFPTVICAHLPESIEF